MLDVVAVDPQEEHVAGEMHESGVQEHRGEERRHGRIRGTEPVGEHHEVVGAHLPEQLRRRQAPSELLQQHADVAGQRRVPQVGLDDAERQ